ncbi:M48 family metalloprotease [Undibacterium parvum]|uniref:M48 family peptidase n=1 Tax=Undibacterium parvum TaxID=401471 RepID=A0A3Q9BPC3_9BURK|nr:M48 family metalloprotease [Undibacterium parvum]AZP10990.1 M48 family peptidase [Undibacterium parvum]
MKSNLPLLQIKFLRLLLVAALAAPASLLSTLPSHAQNLPTLGDTAREDLSPFMERKVGEQIMLSVRRDPDFIDDGPTTEYLNRLGNLMLEKRPDARGEAVGDFEFFAVRDPVLNAFAFPGGFIGFHSGLILSAQTESELASVMGHEIGHVSQRHIARMIGSQKLDVLIPLASLLIGALAARSSPDAAMAVIMGGQGVALQRQINFTREAEREADRVGFQILRDAGFDTSGMVSFFGRLQGAGRNYTDTAPDYLRSHPLTSERMADIQGRLHDQRYKQHVDGLDFYLIRARVRVLQDSSVQGLMDAKDFFEAQAKNDQLESAVSAKYGLAFVAYKRHDYVKASALLEQVVAQVERSAPHQAMLKQTSAFASLAIDIAVASKNYELAIKLSQAAMQQLPLSRGLVYQHAETLLTANRAEDAALFLRDQLSLYRHEVALQNLLAKSYEAQGKQALQHIALAEAYAIEGALAAALQQLEIARRDAKLQYFDLSVIDAREREWKEKLRVENLEDKKRK